MDLGYMIGEKTVSFVKDLFRLIQVQHVQSFNLLKVIPLVTGVRAAVHPNAPEMIR